MNPEKWSILDHRKHCLLVVALFLAVLSPGLLWVEIDGSTAAMFPRNGNVFEWEREFSANFSKETALVVVVRAENIFDPAILRKLKSFAAGLEKVDVVRKCDHLFSLEFPKMGPRGFRSLPLVEKMPENAEDAGELRREILSNPLLRGFVVNAEGTAAAFYPTLYASASVPDSDLYAVDSIGAYVASERERGIDAYLAGGPVIAHAVIGHIWHDLFVLGPCGLLVVAVAFSLFFRWRAALLFNLCTSCSSVIATFGFMGWAGIEITPFVAVVMILVFIVGCTEDIHLVTEYLFLRRRGLPQSRAFHDMRHAVFSALVLSSISTALGFYMTAVSDIPALKDFAIACGTGILLNFFFTILLAPLFLRGEVPRPRRGSVFRLLFVGLLRLVVAAAARRPVQSGLGAAAVCCLALWGSSRVVVDNDFMHFFTESSTVLQDLRKLDEDFSGRSSVVITIETHRRQGVWNQEAISAVAAFQDRLADSFEQAIGLTSYVREYLHQTGASPHREKGAVLLDREGIEFCRSAFGSHFLGRYLDFDGSRTTIRVRSSISGSSDVREAKAVIDRAAAETLPAEWEIRVLGEPVATAMVADSITAELFSSLFLLAVTVTVVLMVHFRSWEVGLLALVPNALPVIATFGFMGWAGIPMGTGVFAVAMAAFGIAVDDTIHLFVRFLNESRRAPSRSFEQILRRCLVRELFPLIVTSITLIGGFSVFLLSGFKVHQETGTLFIVAIGTAFLSDLFLTPLILRAIKSRAGAIGG